jgi:hypothetical protein
MPQYKSSARGLTSADLIPDEGNLMVVAAVKHDLNL